MNDQSTEELEVNDRTELPPTKDAEPNWLLFPVLALLAVTLMLFSWFALMTLLPDWQTRGSFGDMFGVVNALFSGLALVGIILTIRLQMNELRLQRRELEMTRIELRRSATAQERSEQALTEQAKALVQTSKLNALSFLPMLTCNVIRSTLGLYISITNPSNVFAFDIDTLVIGWYDRHDHALSEFLVSYVKQGTRANKLSALNHHGSFGVYDHFTYFMVPSRKKVVAQTAFPTDPLHVFVLLQFRDMQGSNYYQLYWFSKRLGGSDEFQIATLEPVTMETASRIGLDFEDVSDEWDGRPGLTTVDNSEMPQIVETGFMNRWANSFSAGKLRTFKYEVEERGEFRDL